MNANSYRRQRGDTDTGLLFILACVVLFYGEPDVWDALQKWAQTTMNQPTIEAKK